MTIESYEFDDEIDFREVVSVIWLKRWIVGCAVVLCASLSIVVALILPDVYRAEVLLLPVGNSQESGIGALAGQYGVLASIAGVDLSNLKSGDKTAFAIQLVQSKAFVTKFINDHDILINLMAIKSWDRDTGLLTVDPHLYDQDHKRWVRKVRHPFKPKPSMQEAYKAFMDNFEIKKDADEFVHLSFDHVSPILAKQWVDWLVNDLNETVRAQDIAETDRAIDYLEKKMNATSVAELRSVLAQLIEDQLKKVMLANIRSEYVFKTVDPAVIPEIRAKPNRILICILGTFGGGLIAIVVILIRYYWGGASNGFKS